MLNADMVIVILLNDIMIIVIVPNAIMLNFIVMLSDIILSSRMLSVISFYVFVQKVDALSFIIFLS